MVFPHLFIILFPFIPISFVNFFLAFLSFIGVLFSFSIARPKENERKIGKDNAKRKEKARKEIIMKEIR